MLSRLSQFSKVLNLITEIFPRISTDLRLLHKWKTPCSIVVTLEGITIDVRPEQQLKASWDIFVTLSGIVILSRDVHS